MRSTVSQYFENVHCSCKRSAFVNKFRCTFSCTISRCTFVLEEIILVFAWTRPAFYLARARKYCAIFEHLMEQQ